MLDSTLTLDPDWLKSYVSHETLAAFCSLELIAIVWLTRRLLRAYDQRIEDLRVIAPLAEKLYRLSRSAAAGRGRTTPQLKEDGTYGP